jgi:hypothetical protein
MTAAHHIGNPGNPGTEEVLRAVLRLVSFRKKEPGPFEKAIGKFCQVLEVLGSIDTGEIVSDDAESIAAAKLELTRLRAASKTLEIVTTSEVVAAVREADDPKAEELANRLAACLETNTERINARRAYLAWALDENDDRELGREIKLFVPENVKPGPSTKSFAW